MDQASLAVPTGELASALTMFWVVTGGERETQRERERERDRDRDRETETETEEDRQRQRKRDKDRERHRERETERLRPSGVSQAAGVRNLDPSPSTGWSVRGLGPHLAELS